MKQKCLQKQIRDGNKGCKNEILPNKNGNGNNQFIWKTLQEITGPEKRLNMDLKSVLHNDIEVTDPKTMTKIRIILILTIYRSPNRTQINHRSLFQIRTAPNEIIEIISNLKLNKSPDDDDEISAELLKHLAPQIIELLSYIVNGDRNVVYFLSMLKIAAVLPIFKTCDHEQINNYYPIFLIKTTSKIF